MSVLAAISHKGGTGRTTATANVAYRLALMGKNVCCVDLDLTSPTFGSVLGIDGMEVGAERGMSDVLADVNVAEMPSELVVDVWQRNENLIAGVQRGAGRFDLLPGTDTRYRAVPLGSWHTHVDPMAILLDRLDDDYDMVFLDVRSGTSDIVRTLVEANQRSGAKLDSWLAFFRWTPQHLVGAAELCERLDGRPRVFTVRTAYESPRGLHPWYGEQQKELEALMDTALENFKPISSIPFEGMLRWKETVIRDVDVENGIADKRTTKAYTQLASQLVSL